jgi:16S rRNA (cytidine1402-2'-O)-methyltransferase
MPSLYLVSIPIGNKGDITLRALEALKTSSFIFCESVSNIKKLFSVLDLDIKNTTFVHYAKENEKTLLYLKKLWKEDNDVIYVSDAGTPGISDPGYHIIQDALKEGINIVPLPGASALIPALVSSGLPIHRFVYLGFLPKKKGRKSFLEDIVKSPYTSVFYESPHRLEKTLKELENYLEPEHQIVLAHEITKMHESFHRGTLEEITQQIKNNAFPIKGEYVVLVGPENYKK